MDDAAHPGRTGGFQKRPRPFGVDRPEALFADPGSPEGGGAVEDDVDSAAGFFKKGLIAEVALDGLDRPRRPRLMPVDERPYGLASFRESGTEAAPDESRDSGDEDIHDGGEENGRRPAARSSAAPIFSR